MLTYTRREFAKLTLAALPGAGLLPVANRLSAAEAASKAHEKPNSKVAGVQLGINVPYSFADGSMSGDEILRKCVQLGLSAVELRTQPVEAFLGGRPNIERRKKAADGARDRASLRKSDFTRSHRYRRE